MYITTAKSISRNLGYTSTYVDEMILTPTQPTLREGLTAELISTAANESAIFWTWKIVKDLSRDEVQACIDEVGL